MAMCDDIPASLQNCIITDVQLERIVSQGIYGKIQEGKWEGSVVIIKQIHTTFEKASAQEFESFRRNYLLKCDQSIKLHHPNIVHTFGICFLPGIRLPSIVMERLHCSLNDLLEHNPTIYLDIKTSILHQIGLGLRYLHTRVPPIIHRDLSSNNILISKGMEAKIADLGTIRLLDPNQDSPMTIAFGTQDFMPPEVLVNDPEIKYGKELDVFSFGCIMLHTFSQQWPTPSQHVVTDPVEHKIIAQSEIERRAHYLDKVHKVVEDVMVPLIVSCLENLPFDRPTIMKVCDQLETLVVNREQSIPDNLLQAQLMLQEAQDEMEREMYSREIEIETLRSDINRLQITTPLVNNQVNSSSSDFWNSLTVTWQQCADLPCKFWPISVAEMNGMVYATASSCKGGYVAPFVYDSSKDQWSTLPHLPCWYFSLVTVAEKKQLLAVGGMTNNDGVEEVSSKMFLWDEKCKKWLTPYPNMPTGRCLPSSISHGLTVIVAGGLTCLDPSTISRSVEVMHISSDDDSYWSVVEQLPLAVFEAIPLVVNDKLYITVGFDDNTAPSTCTVITASLPELLQSSRNSSTQIWNKLPDMPYTSHSINHYQGHLITFTGVHIIEHSNEEIDDELPLELIPLIHVYNDYTKTWDCVGCVPYGYTLSKSVHIRENKILFVGGVRGTHTSMETGCNSRSVTTCLILTLSPQQ